MQSLQQALLHLVATVALIVDQGAKHSRPDSLPSGKRDGDDAMN